MTLLPQISTIALKEWAVAVNALSQGKQILIMRKGGIHRDDKHFRIMHQEFLLFPTFEHQQTKLIKTEFHENLQAVLGKHSARGMVRLAYWSKVTDIFEITQNEILETLTSHHIWTLDYASKRLNWRPNYPLTVALIRVYKIQKPQLIPLLDDYTGCKSWVSLAQAIPLGSMKPVLSRQQYQEKAYVIKQTLKANI